MFNSRRTTNHNTITAVDDTSVSKKLGAWKRCASQEVPLAVARSQNVQSLILTHTHMLGMALDETGMLDTPTDVMFLTFSMR